MAATPSRRLRLLGDERARPARDGPPTPIDAHPACRAVRPGRELGGAGGRRARVAGAKPALGVHLEPFGERHLAALEEMLDDPDLLRFTRVPEPVPPGFARTWLERYQEGRDEGSREAFAIVDEDGGFLGLALAPRIEQEARTAELGYVVAPAARGLGVATEALRQLTRWAFADLGLLRLELMITVENAASKRVAERCGYVREGVLRSLHVKQGRHEDTELWSRLATEPDPS